MNEITPANGSDGRSAARGHEPISAGRFVAEVYVDADDVWTYATSWDTWEDAEAAFPIEGGRLVDTATGRVWWPGSPYEWEAAQT